jgi:pyrimidine operon attenuation protein / uracil phosphoribosyltransferase
MPNKVQILSREVIDAKLTRMAYEIVEQNFDEKEIVIAGIQGRGVDIAQILMNKIAAISNVRTVSVTILIDKDNPMACSLDEQIPLTDRVVVVVDDVVNSGRTLLYACTPLLMQLLKRLQVAVLVDRRHKNYPVSPDFVGTSVATTLQEHISVEMTHGKVTSAYLS